MMILRPIPITGVSLESLAAEDADHPLSNLLLDHPGAYFAAMLGSAASVATIRVVVSGTVDSFVLHGVTCPVDPISFTNDLSAPVPGAEITSLDDPYYSGRRSYWIRFTPQTGSNLAFRLYLVRTATPGAVVSACVLKAGTTVIHQGLQFPVAKGLDDPTITIQMADGSPYRGAELAPSRVFSPVFKASISAIDALTDDLRILGGRATMFHLRPEGDDRYFVYGRMVSLPQVNDVSELDSQAGFTIREWM